MRQADWTQHNESFESSPIPAPVRRFKSPAASDTRSQQWARLVEQFHSNNPSLPFADACHCGGSLHKWGELVNATCPARSARKQKARMDALGKLLK